MANQDVMPFTSAHGGHNRMEAWEMENAGGAITATFLVGEFCVQGAPGTAGMVDEVAVNQHVITDATVHTFFVAAEDSQANIARLGDARYVDPPAVTKPASMYPLSDKEVEFETRNVFDNNDTNIGPAGSNAMTGVAVGGTCCIRNAAGSHGIDIDDVGLVITRILDAQGEDTYLTGAAADKVIFKSRPLV